MPSKEEVLEALRGVEDPELGMDVVDLGLVYEVELELTFDPPWTPDKMSEDAKFILGFG